MLTTKEMMCVYFGFVSGKENITDKQAKDSLEMTAKILGIPDHDYHELEREALDGLQQVNQIMSDILKQYKSGKDPFKDKGGGLEEWR